MDRSTLPPTAAHVAQGDDADPGAYAQLATTWRAKRARRQCGEAA